MGVLKLPPLRAMASDRGTNTPTYIDYDPDLGWLQETVQK